MKKTLAFAGVLLVAGSLTACGGDGGSDSDYCNDLKAASTKYKDVGSGDVAALEDAFKTFHELADEAPSDIKNDWKTFDTALTGLQDALDDAGLKLSDLAELQANKLPAGVDQAKLTELATKVSELGNADFSKASKAIEKHAKDTCKVDLS